MKSPNAYIKFSGEYFFQFFALGAMLPLLTIYLESIGLSGTQIGTITATGSFIMIFSPPLWGIISDKTHKHKLVNLFLMSMCILSALLIMQFDTFGTLLVVFAFFYFISTPLNPLMDAITLHKKDIAFGKIRLWGSLGFAVAAFITGLLIEPFGIVVIFPIYIIAFLMAMAFLSSIKIDLSGNGALNISDIKKLVTNKTFAVLLLYIFLIAGTLGSHNFFFGLMYVEIGGNESDIGLAFLLFAASEAPFMQLVPRYILRFGIMKILLIAPVLGVIRWALHAILPDPNMHLIIFILQGLFYAPFLIGVAEYIRTRIPNHLVSSAMTIYAAIGFGLGGIFTNFISGLIYDHIGAQMIYAYYCVLCLLSIIVVMILTKLDKKTEGHIL